MYRNPYILSVDTAGFSFWRKISDRCSGGFSGEDQAAEWEPVDPRKTQADIFFLT